MVDGSIIGELFDFQASYLDSMVLKRFLLFVSVSSHFVAVSVIFGVFM